MTPPDPQQMVRYVDAQGRLTREGMELLQRIVASLKDHETRLTALEP